MVGRKYLLRSVVYSQSVKVITRKWQSLWSVCQMLGNGSLVSQFWLNIEVALVLITISRVGNRNRDFIDEKLDLLHTLRTYSGIAGN